MKAAIYNRYGTSEVISIKSIDKPVPGENEILIKVKAATVNRTDCAILTAKPPIMRLITGITKPKRQILGTDFAGIIEAVGSSVENCKPGDKVFGFNDDGSQSHAEYVLLNKNVSFIRMPENIDYNTAAASIEGFHYAYNFVKKVEIKSGSKVLVNGATGAIGSAAIQIANYYGAEITAVCSETHSDLVKSIGAKRIIDYTKEDFTLTDEKFDFVFDAVGKNSFGRCKKILKPDGVYISSEFGAYFQNAFYSIFTPLYSKKIVKFPFPTDIKASLEFSKKLTEQNKFKAVIDKQYKLDDIAEAFSYVLSGKKIGNVVVTI